MRSTSAPGQPGIVFSGPPPFGAVHEEREIVDLVRAVLVEVLADGADPVLGDIILETLSGGRSGAHVFKATPAAAFDRSRRPAPMVVKISPLPQGARERANYDQFVRPVLPAACRPELLGFATAHDRAALCYSFVGDGERPKTLTDRLAAGDLAALDCVLSTLFEKLRQSWYSDGLIAAEADQARYYLDRYFEDLPAAAEAQETLSGCASRYFDAQPRPDGCRIGDIAFPSVFAALFAPRDARAFRSCILHGDLNSDNVILGPDGASTQLIDFQRTGRGDVYQDLVSLEFSVRINYPSSACFSDILEIERLIALGESHSCADPYATAILSVRDAARRCFDFDEDPSAYQFAVAAVGLRLMRATDLSDAARARISASALWAAKTLIGT
jgi:hypothetical protein